jgi:hypothetical protein
LFIEREIKNENISCVQYLLSSIELLLESTLPLKAPDPETVPSVLQNKADLVELVAIDEQLTQLRDEF